MSFALVGPRLLPLLLAASYPAPADDGREWKYSGLVNVWPMSDDPTTLPPADTSDPCAWRGNTACAMPVMTAGYDEAGQDRQDQRDSECGCEFLEHDVPL